MLRRAPGAPLEDPASHDVSDLDEVNVRKSTSPVSPGSAETVDNSVRRVATRGDPKLRSLFGFSGGRTSVRLPHANERSAPVDRSAVA